MKKVLIVLLFLMSFVGVKSQERTDVDKYKALFTVNFARFIGWDDVNREGDFVIGVLKDATIARKISQNTTGKKFGFQEIVVKEFKKVDDITDCQMLYIGSSYYLNKKNMALIKPKISQTPTLIISEAKNGIVVGAMINFVVVDNKLRFEVDVENILNGGLQISNALTGLTNAIVK